MSEGPDTLDRPPRKTVSAIFDEYERRETRKAGIRRGLGWGVGLVVAGYLLFNAPWVQSQIWTHDDKVLGWRMHVPAPERASMSARDYAQAMEDYNARCSDLANAIYDHPIPMATGEEFRGYATRAEKAFYGACLGQHRAFGGND